MTVHAGDADAWPEVSLAGAGWVPLDPSPDKGSSSRPAPPRSVVTVRAAGDPTAGGDAASSRPVATPAVHHHAGGSGTPVWPWLVAGALATLLAGVPAFVLVRKALRRRRRRRAGVLGAWAELLDRLAEHGLRTTSLTTREVQVAAGAQAGTPVGRLGTRVDEVVYGDGSADPGAAWTDLTEAERALRQGTTVRHRVRLRLHPLLGSAT